MVFILDNGMQKFEVWGCYITQRAKVWKVENKSLLFLTMSESLIWSIFMFHLTSWWKREKRRFALLQNQDVQNFWKMSPLDFKSQSLSYFMSNVKLSLWIFAQTICDILSSLMTPKPF